MPVTHEILEPEEIDVITHTCEVCGALAPFGVNVHYRAAVNKFASGRQEEGQALLGQWYCSQHFVVDTAKNII